MANPNDKAQGLIKQIRNEAGKVILDLAGDVDMHSSPALRGELLKLVKTGASVIVINLQDVEFMDSSGLATLVEALQLTRKQKSKIKLINLCHRVRSIFEIARLDAIFEIFDSEAEALA